MTQGRGGGVLRGRPLPLSSIPMGRRATPPAGKAHGATLPNRAQAQPRGLPGAQSCVQDVDYLASSKLCLIQSRFHHHPIQPFPNANRR